MGHIKLVQRQSTTPGRHVFGSPTKSPPRKTGLIVVTFGAGIGIEIDHKVKNIFSKIYAGL
jgi:hypothetical protein